MEAMIDFPKNDKADVVALPEFSEFKKGEVVLLVLLYQK